MWYVVLGTAQTGSHHFPTPPEALDPRAQKNEQRQTPTRRVDYAQLQLEAEDLARIARTIPSDMASARKGMLPKDVIDKLRQIEKLSKRMRAELNPQGLTQKEMAIFGRWPFSKARLRSEVQLQLEFYDSRSTEGVHSRAKTQSQEITGRAMQECVCRSVQ